jgi:hypothetical protein
VSCSLRKSLHSLNRCFKENHYPVRLCGFRGIGIILSASRTITGAGLDDY